MEIVSQMQKVKYRHFSSNQLQCSSRKLPANINLDSHERSKQPGLLFITKKEVQLLKVLSSSKGVEAMCGHPPVCCMAVDSKQKRV